MRIKTVLGAFGLIASLIASAHAEDTKKVVIAYQTGAVPYLVGIANGELAKGTGWDIEFRRFNSGADIFAAIASGDVQIGDVGSSPYAASVSKDLDVKGIYITAGAGDSEALVVRPEIKSAADLKGKKFSAAPVSTDHYQLLAYLKQEGLTENDAQVIAMPQPQIVAAWKRGDIDGAFVWDPALSELKKDGKVLITSGEVSKRGAPVFSSLVVTGDFSKKNPDFLAKYVGLIDKYYVDFANHPDAWGPASDNIKLIAKLQGGTPEENAGWLNTTVVVPLEQQVTDAWLGGGDKGSVAKTLKDTAAFLKEQKKITAVKDGYGDFVDPQFAAAALASN
ncbi:taurine transport system substrate-binding protein [Phyllobacterium sp. YR620]|uniref:taurine ABC transporter substrate-binding protein n=1 Tax=unclassified Phyllobacterium TaxID=2638441 RepID=UPI0006897B8E|nr:MULTISPECIES: glycine betaine ABC transporter substrate-binding protein [unclassified Phyllobacterium]SDP88340.1 taurine transport system substrate-binding protein [Phyllobacterium sp. YR620]